MKRVLIATLIVVYLGQGGSIAQAPSVGPTTPTPPGPIAYQFDNGSLQVKREAGRWQLWAGNRLLKDFGAGEREANDALQVFRDLRVTSFASIGGVFDYWLADGQAPSAITRRRTVVPFDPATLRVERMGGQWVLRDARITLFSFGPARADAEAALAVCQRYGFDQLGYVGHPTPVLKYLLKDPEPRRKTTNVTSIVPASAVMLSAEAGNARLDLPGVGDVGERMVFDGRRLDLRRENGEWMMYSGRVPVGRFGPGERDARMTLQLLEQFRVSELCRIGDSGFGFFLANGRAPTGTTIGTGARPIRTELLDARQVGGVWAVCEGERPLFTFGDRADDAQHALAAIRHFRFDHVAPVGNGHLGQVYLLIKTK